MTYPFANPWAAHYQSVWQERSRDTAYPLWQRVAMLAFGTHLVNGHAGFAEGELATSLGTTGDQLSRAIRHAKGKGWISAESNSRCLVVPPHAITGGAGGSVNTACQIHHGRRLRRHSGS